VCGAGAAIAFEKDAVGYFDCSACGFRFSRQTTNPNLDQDLEQFESAYLQYLGDDPADDANFSALLRSVAAPPRATWLDVGCGSGKFVRYLRRHGFDAEGVEPSAALFDHFLSDEPFFHRDLAAVAGRRFAVVSALDVIEHVGDPVAFLAALRDAAEPTGTIVLSTPDIAGLTVRALGKRWHHYNRYHLSFLSPATLDDAARRAGLEVRSVTHPWRRRSLGYSVRYLCEFGLRRDAPRLAQRFDRIQLPVNLGDILLATLSPRRQ
jgi:2-polyprenyl-3-methyl-5-hydroxy-6-metoxy-1,4-benzoquinol methylase